MVSYLFSQSMCGWSVPVSQALRLPAGTLDLLVIGMCIIITYEKSGPLEVLTPVCVFGVLSLLGVTSLGHCYYHIPE